MAGRIADYFAQLDTDKNGVIDLSEFRVLLQRLGINRSDAAIARVFSAIDVDGNGTIDLSEFSRWWASVDSR